MNLKTFLSDFVPDARERFAQRCGTTKRHLQNVMYGQKSCAPELATQIEINSDRKVMRWETRPEDWHRIWPELVSAPGAPKVRKQKAAA